jgi:hypothetical protein
VHDDVGLETTHRTLQRERLPHIATYQRHPVEDTAQVLRVSRDERVVHHDSVPGLDQCLDGPRPNEAGSTRYQHAHSVNTSIPHSYERETNQLIF